MSDASAATMPYPKASGTCGRPAGRDSFVERPFAPVRAASR
ncbi:MULTISPECIES: hypothetical protein [Dermacoccus]|nr:MULTISPECIES: hypothetical protein [Dermacoccus]